MSYGQLWFKSYGKKDPIGLKYFGLFKSVAESRRWYLKYASCVVHSHNKKIKNMNIVKKYVFQRFPTI